MSHLESYLETVALADLKDSISNTSCVIMDQHLGNFDFQSHVVGLLLGEVQSGKTGQMFGVIAKAADKGFDLFIVLTTDNIRLQEQTYRRALQTLDTLCVCSENDEIRFSENHMRKPVVVFLKKNGRVLSRWRNNLSSSGFLSSGRSIFIVDDEGDSSSLNTQVNRRKQSTINRNLESLKHLATSSVYLQVTATPQSILLQQAISGFRPGFCHYFKPGPKYLGGDFFYAEPRSFSIRITDQNEFNDIVSGADTIPEGLIKAISIFLVTASHVFIKKQNSVCNFLVHPSRLITDHDTFAERVGELLNEYLSAITENNSLEHLKDAWIDLQNTKPDLIDFECSVEFIKDTLENQNFNVCLLNSNSDPTTNYNSGINIIIGGNTLGRGVTFSGLQTVYYCRAARVPQADTFWQHCRMYGYDRDPALMRIFMPQLLLNVFTNLNRSHQTLIGSINTNGIDKISLIYPPSIRPTRNNVININHLINLIGGVHYFPQDFTNLSNSDLDVLLLKHAETSSSLISHHEANSLLSSIETNEGSSWQAKKFINCINSLVNSKPSTKCYLIVRTNRQVRYGTGTLLSQNDRDLANSFPDSVVIVMYKTSELNLGWSQPGVWIPNIRLPDNSIFYQIDG